jgi:hypothetical protein
MGGHHINPGYLTGQENNGMAPCSPRATKKSHQQRNFSVKFGLAQEKKKTINPVFASPFSLQVTTSLLPEPSAQHQNRNPPSPKSPE